MNSLSKLEKDFKELRGRELKIREIQIDREIEELVCKLVIVSIDDVDKFEEKLIIKKRPFAKNTW